MLVSILLAAAAMGAVNPGVEARARFAAAWRAVHANSAGPVDDEALLAAAVKGMLGTLGPHNDWISLPRADTTRAAPAGIGVSLKIMDGLPVVVAASAGAAAAGAGLGAGDVILAIDDQPMRSVPLETVVAALRGPDGSAVRLRVSRAGADPAVVELIRHPVVVERVASRVIGRIGVIRLNAFGPSAAKEVARAVVDLDRQVPGQARGFVLDVRDNPGGLFDQAVAVADLFMAGGVVVTQRGRTSREVATYAAQAGDALRGRPLVVLVNPGSAAASEVVAAALQDSGRARIVGTPTFGKGGVETVLPLSATTALRLTTSRLFRPSGAGLQWRGVVPDVVVASPAGTSRLRERDLPGSLPDPDAVPVPMPPNAPDGRDRQLDAAVALIPG